MSENSKSSKKIKIHMVTLKEPCTACNIIGGLLRDMLTKLKTRYSEVEVSFEELQHLKEASAVEGLEVEKFPALLINGEQITAGTLPQYDQLVMLLESEMNDE